ncbi:MAG TPA: hypothetical protein PK758_03005, partial [Tenuifilaceae bacterium]|nr:hypothetical protein [Tenuifilaceae bacterium]
YERLRNAHRYLASNVYKGDGDNNFVVLDYNSPTPINSGNVLGHLVYAINSTHIHDVISNGKVIVRNRNLTTVDESIIHNESKKLAQYLWECMAK